MHICTYYLENATGENIGKRHLLETEYPGKTSLKKHHLSCAMKHEQEHDENVKSPGRGTSLGKGLRQEETWHDQEVSFCVGRGPA